MENNEIEKIKENLYSRQIATYGTETMNKLKHINLLILGMRGNGVEIAKNIILSGINKVTIYDNNLVQINDLGSNYYLKDEHINKVRRDEAILNNLKDLNPFVNIDVLYLDNEALISYLEKNKNIYNVIVQSELISKSKLIELNNFCHKNNIYFIYGCCMGLSGFIFTDFCDEHNIRDRDGKELLKYKIKNITNEENALIETIENKNINLNVDDYIQIINVEGMNELNNKTYKIISKKDDNKFYLDCNSTNFNKYAIGGIIKKLKKIEIKKYNSFEKNIEIPFTRKNKEEYFTINENDELIIYTNKYYLSIILSLMEYLIQSDLFYNIDDNIIKLISDSANDLFNKIKNNDKKNKILYEGYNEDEFKSFDFKQAYNIIKYSKLEIIPMCSFIGGIISQEIIKSVGIYEPIDQWVFFDFYYILKNNVNDNKIKELTSRYDEMKLIFGNEFQDKLSELNLFVIGAGAIGCEILKNISMLGFSTKGLTTVTDCDNIEMSNLNRQFLFRKEDIGKSKSLIACNNIKNMNKDFNTQCLEYKVCKETNCVFNKAFFDKQNYVICCLDNIEARNYINDLCHKYNKIFLDSGTNGTKGRLNTVIPFKTKELYFPKNNDNNKNESLPMCTLRNYPQTIEHCIEWSREKFDEFFNYNIKKFKNYILYDKRLDDDTECIFNESYNLFLYLFPIINNENLNDKINSIIKYAIYIFNYYFSEIISNILKDNPLDKKNKDGTPYWSSIKRPPKILNINDINNNSDIYDFIKSFTEILLRCFNIDKNNNDINYKDIIIDILKNKEVKESKELNRNEKTDILNNMKNNLKNKNIFIKEELFEKDGINNYHIDFIKTCSNLRAANYYIEPCDKNKALIISGKIIQAIPTSTSIVSGFLTLQLINLVLNNNDKSTINNLTFYLHDNCFVFSELENYKPKIVNIEYPREVIINNSLSCFEFIDYIHTQYNLEVFTFEIDGQIIFTKRNFILPLQQEKYDEYNKKYNKKIEDLYKNIDNNKEFLIKIMAKKINSDNQCEYVTDFPLIKYIPFKNK